MSVPEGIRSIRSAADPTPLLGGRPGTGEIPIVTDGPLRRWNIQRIGECYTLELEGTDSPLRFARDDNGNVVADPITPATQWRITGPDGGPNVIQLPDSPLVWTVNQPGVNDSPVTLEPMRGSEPPLNQRVYIVLPQ